MAPYKPRAVANLVVIEAPGKVTALTGTLRRAGLNDFHVLATPGHIFEMPEGLDPVGIDHSLTEVDRAIGKQKIADSIREWASRADRVLIASDADQEGDVLACDVASLLPAHPSVHRVRLRSLDLDGVTSAFASPEPIEDRDAWPGTTRRIVDRLIGATFSRSGADGEAGMGAGRIQSALLGIVARSTLAHSEAIISLRACDKRDPFVAVIPVTHENEERMRELVERAQDFERSGRCLEVGSVHPAPDFEPWSYGEAVLNISRATERGLDSVSTSMQRLYENGRMSYPRSSAHAITGDGLAFVSKIADSHAVKFDAQRLPAFARRGRHAHESPRPLSGRVDISSALLLLSPDEAVLSLLARHLLACGQPHHLHKPEPSKLPELARGMKLQRKVCQWLTPWPRRPATTTLRERPMEEIALELLIANKLGRPSTLISHAQKFASRGLLDDQARLSARGRSWLEQTPEVLLDARTSARIEQMIDASAEAADPSSAPEQLARRILVELGLWERVQPLLGRTRQAGQGLPSPEFGGS
jgi:DNA topoisomerase-1